MPQCTDTSALDAGRSCYGAPHKPEVRGRTATFSDYRGRVTCAKGSAPRVQDDGTIRCVAK
jgi:hypothetical protein